MEGSSEITIRIIKLNARKYYSDYCEIQMFRIRRYSFLQNLWNYNSLDGMFSGKMISNIVFESTLFDC